MIIPEDPWLGHGLDRDSQIFWANDEISKISMNLKMQKCIIKVHGSWVSVFTKSSRVMHIEGDDYGFVF